MPPEPVSVDIRPATREDLPALYRLAQQSLTLDLFSEELLAEKLLLNPWDEPSTWETYVAERGGVAVGFLQSAIRPRAKAAWIGLFAVAEHRRRRGIASALVEHARAAWPAEIETVEVLAIPGNYFSPGLDPRYTEALCFLERRGFERFKDCVNLIGDLSEPFDTSSEEQRLANEEIDIRRATHNDNALLDAFFANDFGAGWRLEASLAMRNDPPALHLALRGGQIIAFSAHSTQNREWGFFGPMGTTPAARGHGLGRVLLWHCLNDMRAAGHPIAVIPWVGPIAFYQQWAGCRVERVFWRYRMKIE